MPQKGQNWSVNPDLPGLSLYSLSLEEHGGRLSGGRALPWSTSHTRTVTVLVQMKHRGSVWLPFHEKAGPCNR